MYIMQKPYRRLLSRVFWFKLAMIVIKCSYDRDLTPARPNPAC